MKMKRYPFDSEALKLIQRDLVSLFFYVSTLNFSPEVQTYFGSKHE